MYKKLAYMFFLTIHIVFLVSIYWMLAWEEHLLEFCLAKGISFWTFAVVVTS